MAGLGTVVQDFSRASLAVGFGNAIPLFFAVPVVLLYSYTRIPKNRKISMLIPVVGIVLMVIVIL